MRNKFEKKMNELTNDQVIDLIKSTWNEQCGVLFREIGFEILEQRNGEEYSDRVYAELFNEMQAA